mgnify:CR=1 FL=1
MTIMASSSDPPEPVSQPAQSHLDAAIHDVRRLGLDYIKSLALIRTYADRCPGLVDKSLFFRVSDLLTQSGLAAAFLVAEGMQNPARRESRFLLEASIKLLFADQQMPTASLDQRLLFFERRVAASGFADELKQINFGSLESSEVQSLIARINHLYGKLSQFVHATHQQLSSYLASQATGHAIGLDSAEMVTDAASDLFHAYEISLLLCLFAAGPSLAGDLLLAFEQTPWVFHAGPSIAAFDATYDYKRERQANLSTLRQVRSQRVADGWRAQYRDRDTAN